MPSNRIPRTLMEDLFGRLAQEPQEPPTTKRLSVQEMHVRVDAATEVFKAYITECCDQTLDSATLQERISQRLGQFEPQKLALAVQGLQKFGEVGQVLARQLQQFTVEQLASRPA